MLSNPTHLSLFRFEVRIVSGDQDLFQLVNDTRHIGMLYSAGECGEGSVGGSTSGYILITGISVGGGSADGSLIGDPEYRHPELAL